MRYALPLALVRNVEIFVMPGMIYRDRKRKKREGPATSWPEGGRTDHESQSRIFMAMRGGEEGKK